MVTSINIRDQVVEKITLDLRNEKIRTMVAQVLISRMMTEESDIIYIVAKTLFERVRKTLKKLKLTQAEYALLIDSQTVGILEPGEQIYLATAIKT